MAQEYQSSLILTNEATDEVARSVLEPVGFADWQSARACLLRLGDDPHVREPLAECLAFLLLKLQEVANPDRVLTNLERYVRSIRARDNDIQAFFRQLAQQPRSLETLLTLFAGSQFLTEILLRQPEYVSQLVDHRHLPQLKTVEQLAEEARVVTEDRTETLGDKLDSLRRFQRRELLRIGTCDLLGLLDLAGVTLQLSNLAEALVRGCLELAANETGLDPAGFAVLALGKLGGQELNYSSDIDLVFVTARSGTSHQRLGEHLISALTRTTGEGFLYRVDMRLRPWGRVGVLVPSVEGYLNYLKYHARLWEKQALLKARAIAGDLNVATEFLHQSEPWIFSTSPEAVRAAVYEMKRRTEAQVRQQGQEWGNVKLGEGSLRDIEFVVQYLQLVHGGTQPAIRCPNTLEALRHLADQRLISIEQYRILSDGYVFLRTVEHYLQLLYYRQTHTLPDDSEALAALARRLGFRGEEAGKHFVGRYEQHRRAIRTVYLRILGNDAMEHPHDAQPAPPEVERHIARMDPSYADTFTLADIRRHALLAAHLDAAHLVQVDAEPLEGGRWRVTLVGYDYPGELSLICGLLLAYGFSIVDGNVFTYEPTSPTTSGGDRRKIVDVFTVEPVRATVTEDLWATYAKDLNALLQLMESGQRNEAHAQLVKRVASALHEVDMAGKTLYPVDIEIDNTVSDRYTVLRIDALDTMGFLYELTNALAFNRIYIARVTVDSVGERVRDTLYVTDANGQKITALEKQRELRVATVLIKHFTHLLPLSPNPEAALIHFREFIHQLFQRPNWPDEIASLERHEVLHALAQVLGVSDFLWDDFLRMQYANLFPVVQDVEGLTTARTRAQLQAELEAQLRAVHPGPQPPSDEAPWRAVLNAFKDREMFRIDMRHILGHTQEFWDFAEELTDLVEVVVNAAFHLCHEDLRTVYGTPCLDDGRISEMVVCALGKCGGRELGFASDIELMFIYAGNGRTSGPQVITTAEFYEKLVQMFIKAIQARREGIFEIDLQLRPYGRAGSLAVSLEAFRRYFAPDGPAWAYERQALVKLRPIAGDMVLGQQIVALRDEFVYTGERFDVVAMRAMRERQIRHLVAGGTFNAKYSPGGLVDLEYLVQGLQISYGHRDPSLRVTNIREAMAALARAGILSPDDYTRLRKAHTFLRWLIDGLRMVRGNARDLTVPPPESEEFAFLARRLRYGNDVARLREDLARHTAYVQELMARLLG